MDISIFSNLNLIAIFLPLFFGLYLFISKLEKSYVNKKMLNWGTSIVNLTSLLIFSLTHFFIPNGNIIKSSFTIFSNEKFNLDFGLLINDSNLTLLTFCSFLCFIISLYTSTYFIKKKQFIFTKQRFYAFLSILSSLTYIALASANLFQSIMIIMSQAVALLFFSYFDIFKSPTNYNITRFHRISHIGNFALLFAALILFKYAVLSQGYIESTSLDFDELNILASYMYGLSSSFEFKLTILALIIATFSRFCIFPLSCYYSFFANSSNILFLATISIFNNIIGLFIFLKLLPLMGIFEEHILFFEIYLCINILISLIQILFERNIKIISGYSMSIINSIFIILFLNFNLKITLLSYACTNSIFLLFLMNLFYIDKTNFKKRLINKQMGFLLEKTHIFIFEKFPSFILKIAEIIDNNILQNILSPVIKFFNYASSLFIQKTIKTNETKCIRNILIIFAIIALFAIIIALFGGFKC